MLRKACGASFACHYSASHDKKSLLLQGNPWEGVSGVQMAVAGSHSAVSSQGNAAKG